MARRGGRHGRRRRGHRPAGRGPRGRGAGRGEPPPGLPARRLRPPWSRPSPHCRSPPLPSGAILGAEPEEGGAAPATGAPVSAPVRWPVVTARLITIEGLDGAGKSTLAEGLVRELSAAGTEVELLREPGGVEASERIRELVQDP